MKKRVAIEIAAVVLISIGRPLLDALGAAAWVVNRSNLPFAYFHLTECIKGVYIAGVVAFVIWLKQESWTELGIQRLRWRIDLGLGVLVSVLFFLFRVPFAVLFTILHVPEKSNPFQSPSSSAEYLWIVMSAIIVGFSEELLTRGYLISRLERLFGQWQTLLISSLIFALWHVFRGFEELTYAFIGGLIFGFTFIKSRRLWPVIIAHAINNAAADFVSLGRS